MLPVLLDLKFIKIYTFGAFLVLSFFWAMFLLWRNIKLTSYKEKDVFDSLFLSLFGGLFFARLFFVLFNFEDFGFNLIKFVLINGYPGMSLMGGLLGAFLTLYLHLKYIRKIEVSKLIDYFIPPLFLALSVGKIGSFFAGVDVGTKTNLFLRVNYFGFEEARHIVAVYEALLFGLGAFLAHRILMAQRREELPNRFSFYFFLFYFSFSNLLLDKLKINHLYFLRRSFNFVASAVLFIVSAVYFLYFFRKQMAVYLFKFKSFTLDYGQKAAQKISRGIKKEAFKGGKKTSQRDRKSKGG